MTQYPAPIALSDSVPHARNYREKEVIHAASWGVIIRCTIILFELLGVYLFSSSAILLDAVASIVDVISSMFLIICIKLASRPPDEDHPFGHGRYEPLAGLQLGLLMVLVGLAMMGHQCFQLAHVSETGVIDPRAWVIPLVATLFLEICYQLLNRTAKKQHSPALAADAVHYRLDAITSLFATLALGFGAYIPVYSLLVDHIGAITIAILMVGLGVWAARSNLHQLMDRIPDDHFFETVKKASLEVPGVLDTEKIRIQLYGPDAHVDIDVEVAPQLPVELAHGISQKVRAAIQEAWPAVRDVTVHIEPYYPNDH